MNGIRSREIVIRGGASNTIDANKLAQQQSQKVEQQRKTKESKLSSFINGTKLKASRLQKQMQLIQKESKKDKLQKQKLIQAQYSWQKPKIIQKQECQSSCEEDAPAENVQQLMSKREQIKKKMLCKMKH